MPDLPHNDAAKLKKLLDHEKQGIGLLPETRSLASVKGVCGHPHRSYV
jgi:hypothetical protein